MMEMIAVKELTMALFMVLSCAFSGVVDTGSFEIIIMENNRQEVSIPVEYRNGKYLIYNDKKEVEVSITLKDKTYVFEADGKKEEFSAKDVMPPTIEGNGKATKTIDGIEVLFLSTEGVRSILPVNGDKWAIIKSITKPSTPTK